MGEEALHQMEGLEAWHIMEGQRWVFRLEALKGSMKSLWLVRLNLLHLLMISVQLSLYLELPYPLFLTLQMLKEALQHSYELCFLLSKVQDLKLFKILYLAPPPFYSWFICILQSQTIPNSYVYQKQENYQLAFYRPVLSLKLSSWSTTKIYSFSTYHDLQFCFKYLITA